jgi:hypothetical protein
VALVGLGLALLGVTTFGAVTGTEFPPHRFVRHQFAYYQIPVIRLLVSPVWLSPVTNDLETALKNQQLLGRVQNAPQRWDGVMLYAGRRLVRRGDASILTQYLDAKNSADELVWLKWTTSHPDLAKQLWPAIADVARHGLYIFVPDLFDAATQATDATKLSGQLHDILARRFQQAAEVESVLGNHQRATELRQLAASHRPGAGPSVPPLSDSNVK